MPFDLTSSLDVVAAVITAAYVLKLMSKLSAIERACLFDGFFKPGFLGPNPLAGASYFQGSGIQKRSLLDQQVLPRV